MNGRKGKQARRLTTKILTGTPSEKLEPVYLNANWHRVKHPLTGEVFTHETYTYVNPRRRAYRRVKQIIREMPRLV